MVNIEEKTANFEIISAIVLVVGMISLMMSEVAGLLFILAGTGSLILVYGVRLVALPKEEEFDARSKWVGQLNYTVLIIGLIMMVSLIFAAAQKQVYPFIGIAMLAGLAILDLLVCTKWPLRLNLVYCEIRIILMVMLLLLFYYVPIM